MPIKFEFKDIVEETRQVKRRVLITGIAMLLLFGFLVTRLIYLQIIQHDHFITLSQNNRVKVVPIAPIRGLIYSRDGVLLAENQPAFSLEVIPEKVNDLDALLSEISLIIDIREDDIARFWKSLREKRRFESVPLKFNLNEAEVARFSVQNHRFPAVEVIARPYRRYPENELTAHIIGYVGRIDDNDLQTVDVSNYLGSTHIGKIGVEKAYENILHGQVGHQQVEVNAQGRVIRVLERTPPIPGKNIFLTIDIGLQKVAMKSLQGKRGAIVAMDPTNGDILALVSAPSYDPNLFVNGINYDTYNGLLSSKDTPLVNRALQGTYPPGSTIKPFLGLTALTYGVREPDDTIWCPGWYRLKGSSHLYRDWKREGHGEVDFNYAIMQSCDVYYYDTANDLGITRLHDGLLNFGFGNKTGIDIGGEAAGLVPSPEWKRKTYNQPWYPGETLIAGIGQGSLLVTPLQLVNATASLANNGKLYAPHLAALSADQISHERNDIQTVQSSEIGIYQAAQWEIIKQAMIDVVHGERGTARGSGYNSKYRMAGKTGTAQVIAIAQDEEYLKEDIPEELQDHALFIAFAPAEEPSIAVAVIVENGGSGSSSAAPIARQLFDYYLADYQEG
jgi:penicillin-binding protein 2